MNSSGKLCSFQHAAEENGRLMEWEKWKETRHTEVSTKQECRNQLFSRLCWVFFLETATNLVGSLESSQKSMIVYSLPILQYTVPRGEIYFLLYGNQLEGEEEFD